MKTIFFSLMVIAITLVSEKKCSAQPPQWVENLTEEVFTLQVGQITQWEEKQMTWFNINGFADGSDSVSVNTLYVEGITTTGEYFIGAIPVNNQVLTPLGSRAIAGQTCTGMCGCQCCKLKKDDYGCYCDTGENCCIAQSCTCWCQHTLVSSVK